MTFLRQVACINKSCSEQAQAQWIVLIENRNQIIIVEQARTYAQYPEIITTFQRACHKCICGDLHEARQGIVGVTLESGEMLAKSSFYAIRR